MSKPLIMHMITTAKNLSPFDVNMAYDAGWDNCVPYTNIDTDEVEGIVQDAIFSRTPGLNKTGIFIGGRDPHKAIEMLNICKDSLVPPFTLSAFADPSGSFTTAAGMIAKVEYALKNKFDKTFQGQKVVVFGGTGPVGCIAGILAASAGAEVIILGRKKFEDLDPRKINFFDNVNCHYINLDMNNILNLSDELKSNKIEILENCIFYNIAWGTANNLSDLDIKGQLANVEWSLNAYNIAVKLGCTKFIHVGTMEEGFTRKYLDLDYKKDNKYNRHIIYSLAKIASKDCLKLNYDRKHNISLIFVNNSHVMGPLDNKDSFLQVTLGKLIKKEELIFSTGEQYFDCISVFDVARAYLLVGEKGLNGKEYWIGSGEARQLKEYVMIMYSLYPSGMKMNFGHFDYNDISLTKEDFSIKNLITDTGFKPSNTFEDTVQNLANHLNSGKVVEI